MSVARAIVPFRYRSPLTPARIGRLLRAPSLAKAVGGRTVLVTGASSGIGRATALRLGAAGATVLLVARTTDALEEVRAEINAAGSNAHVHRCDLVDPDALEDLAAEVHQRHGAVDVLVNNAGRSIRRAIDQSYDRAHDFERTMALNYFAPVRLTLALLPAMRRRRFGHIINVSTLGVQINAPRFSAYTASKAALDAFSRCIAAEVHADGVRVTTVHPPLVHTPMVAPIRVYDDAPGLTADEAADMIVEAITTKPTRVATRRGRAFEIARLLAPTALQATQSFVYRRSLDTESRMSGVLGMERAASSKPPGQPRGSGARVALWKRR